MRKIYILLIFASIIFMSTKTYAYESNDLIVDRKDNNKANLKIDSKNRNIKFFTNFLYWKTTETIDWATAITQNQNIENIDLQTISFDWKPGFRVGMGYRINNWDIQFFYTYFNVKSRDSFNVGTGLLKSAFFGATISELGDYQSGKINLKINLNMLDIDLGNNLSICKCLYLRPFIGIKGGWIDQSIYTEWRNPNFLGLNILLLSNENIKNNFRGIGPKGGVNGKWILGNFKKNTFSLFGNFTANYLWGHWVIKDKFFDNLNTTFITKIKNRNFGAFVLQGIVGISSSTNFNKNRSNLTISLGYEIEDWFNQYQVLDDLSGAQNNDLLFQGLNLNLQFEF